MDESNEQQPNEGSLRRLWTPWRMQYVGGATRETGCVFCNRLAGNDDVQGLILHRGRRAFTIMNLFPYNTGHVMLVPNEHVPSPENASAEAMIELAERLPVTLRAARRALNCHGFNVGLNVGSIAGAGIAEHMHQHIVPRWNGDANFMPIIGSTMVMPELIPVTYAKLRAELAPRTSEHIPLVMLDESRQRIIVAADGAFPRIAPPPVGSISDAALELAASLGVHASIAGWAGSNRADEAQSIGLTLLAAGDPVGDARWRSIDQFEAAAAFADRETLADAVANLAHSPRS